MEQRIAELRQIRGLAMGVWRPPQASIHQRRKTRVLVEPGVRRQIQLQCSCIATPICGRQRRSRCGDSVPSVRFCSERQFQCRGRARLHSLRKKSRFVSGRAFRRAVTAVKSNGAFRRGGSKSSFFAACSAVPSSWVLMRAESTARVWRKPPWWRILIGFSASPQTCPRRNPKRPL